MKGYSDLGCAIESSNSPVLDEPAFVMNATEKGRMPRMNTIANELN
jgi:hypothetical protein